MSCLNLGWRSHSNARHSLLFDFFANNVLSLQQSNVWATKTIKKNQNFKLLFLALELSTIGNGAIAALDAFKSSISCLVGITSRLAFYEKFDLGLREAELRSCAVCSDRGNNRCEQCVRLILPRPILKQITVIPRQINSCNRGIRRLTQRYRD